MTAGDQPPTVTIVPAEGATVSKAANPLTVTVTGVRGMVTSVTASGCGAAAETDTAPAGAASLSVDLTIPAGQGNGDCDITVETEFLDVPEFGGEDRQRTDVVEVAVTN